MGQVYTQMRGDNLGFPGLPSSTTFGSHGDQKVVKNYFYHSYETKIFRVFGRLIKLTRICSAERTTSSPDT